MTKEEVKTIVEKIPLPITKIEEAVGMPKNTLHYAIKGTRELPRKWVILFSEWLENRQKTKPDPPEAHEPPPIADEEAIKQHNEAIEQQIAAIKSRRMPDYIKTTLGRKSWESDQQKEINELKKQLK